ncbi:hypothetical protein [Isoptericola hypogeus]
MCDVGESPHYRGATAGASRFLVDERPDLVVDRARALFARAA